MVRSAATLGDARTAAQRFAELDAGFEVSRLGNGLIHDTFAVDSGTGAFVLQRVHPVFPPEIHINILATTQHLARKGVPAPRLLPERDGRLWAETNLGIWRLMTRLPGSSFDAVTDPAEAEAAAFALGRFHGALADLAHEFVGRRSGVHDTAAHLVGLEQALAEHPAHRLAHDVERLADRIFHSVERLQRVEGVAKRLVHGDPKFNNVLFADEADGRPRDAIGLVDLDTVGPMELHLELGDAWRSWCNPKGEDDREGHFRLDVFEASLAGYARARPFPLEALEREALLDGVEWITVELAARFAADALRESYFGWDPTRYTTRGAHNLERASGQWALHERVLATRGERARLLRAVASRL